MSALLELFRGSSAYYGGNAAFIEDLYERYLKDPESIDLAWRKRFDAIQQEAANEVAHGPVRENFQRLANESRTRAKSRSLSRLEPAAAEKPEKPRQRTRLSYKDQRELDGLPDRIAGLETEIAALEKELADPDLFKRDPDRFDKAAKRLDAAREELGAAEERWLELEAEREQLESVKAGAA